jgi:hypothetical protein
MKYFDAFVQNLVKEKGLSAYVPWYFMASYMYYKKDTPILSDGFFDNMCKEMHKNFSKLEHRHLHLIHIDDLSAGTCLIDEADYPSVAISAAQRVLEEGIPDVEKSEKPKTKKARQKPKGVETKTAARLQF